LNSGNRCQFAVLLVECDLARDINIRHAVAIGETEGFFILDVISDSFQAATRERLITGIYQRHTPWFSLPLMDFHLVMLHVESDIRHV